VSYSKFIPVKKAINIAREIDFDLQEEMVKRIWK